MKLAQIIQCFNCNHKSPIDEYGPYTKYPIAFNGSVLTTYAFCPECGIHDDHELIIIPDGALMVEDE